MGGGGVDMDGCGGWGEGCEGRGRVESQRRERSQVSKRASCGGVRGRRGRVRVEIVWGLGW